MNFGISSLYLSLVCCQNRKEVRNLVCLSVRKIENIVVLAAK